MTANKTAAIKPPKAPPKAPAGLRQAMAWLHTWIGLWFSWLLFAVFLTGTLSIFAEPISHWMGPEHALEEYAASQQPANAAPADRGHRLALAVAHMARHSPDAAMWEIWPVNRNHDNGLVTYLLDEHGNYSSTELDPVSGLAMAEHDGPPPRASQGGHHFVAFHYELHAGKIGMWVVAFATMAMLVALISGIIIHKRIFQDFFTFRPSKGQRSWLDAHNAVAVLTLPFQLMIAYTGLAFFGITYMPAPVMALYGAGEPAVKQYVADVNEPGKAPRNGVALAVPDLEPLAARAERAFGQPVRAIVIHQPGDTAMRICVYGWNDALLTRLSPTTGMACYAGAGGAQLRLRQPGGADAGPPAVVQQAMGGLHMADFGGLAVRWLYFVCGLAGAAMMATGALLFIVKRRARYGSEFGALTARVYRLIEGMNVAAIAGLALACAGYLWANRLVPLGIAGRADWEVRIFFALWLFSLGHAFLRPVRRAWIEQLSMLAALCLLLPLLNLLTTGDHLPAQIARGDWESAGVELAALGFAALAARAAWHIQHRRAGAPARPAARRGATSSPAMENQ